MTSVLAAPGMHDIRCILLQRPIHPAGVQATDPSLSGVTKDNGDVRDKLCSRQSVTGLSV